MHKINKGKHLKSAQDGYYYYAQKQRDRTYMAIFLFVETANNFVICRMWLTIIVITGCF